MNSVKFHKAENFLVERLALGSPERRLGARISAKVAALDDAEQRIASAIGSAVEAVQTVLSRKLADFKSENQRSVVKFFYAESQGIPAPEQVSMVVLGKDSSGVAMAAAQQRRVPVSVQAALVEHCAQHAAAMRALANNAETRPVNMMPLVDHPDRQVRIAVSAHIGSRMRVQEAPLDNEKHRLYNAMVNSYEDGYAEFLIPVCRDPDQLQLMYDSSKEPAKNSRLFADNPFSPSKLLIAIVDSSTLRLIPGGREVQKNARAMIETRLVAEEHSTPEM